MIKQNWWLTAGRPGLEWKSSPRTLITLLYFILHLYLNIFGSWHFVAGFWDILADFRQVTLIRLDWTGLEVIGYGSGQWKWIKKGCWHLTGNSADKNQHFLKNNQQRRSVSSPSNIVHIVSLHFMTHPFAFVYLCAIILLEMLLNCLVNYLLLSHGLKCQQASSSYSATLHVSFSIPC